ncbi:NADH:flavin oxidoreductase/NADH oxidase [Sphingobacterium sp. SRCM116780]|uniref:NADH:flavin oxidoreductase/NADH oxidase n=1 Tax=Sphingobacterium sp. SRCM116780 TaxID=2907623 RepID=UPI001F229D85|nr:NADH:flavin oxidoreductase/NADH oxidase [Sphingobacterium sp. SRCM116780]UIR57947.1 NADH:flavin oxidoreductase/NADH oxidase [Sphingobacterium sp. SRCM116780]
MSILFSSLQLKHIHLKNRLVVSPMCQYSAINGFANNWHLVHLGQFATGGAAAVIQEATAVSPEGRISASDLGIWKDEHIEKLKEITTFIKENDAVPGIQLAHAGRKASAGKPWVDHHQIAPDEENGWQSLAPSAIAFNPERENAPIAMSLEEIQKTVFSFQQATKRAINAGYEIIEIHAAHGYLIHQFLSPLSNNRIDEYGGSFENRARFLYEIVQAIKKELTTQSLWVRISATDWADGGWDLEQSIKLAKELKKLDVEVIDVSSGGAVYHQKIKVEKDYQLPFAAAIKKEVEIITATVGLIREADHAEEILKDGKSDIIMIARAFLKNPHLPFHFAEQLADNIKWPSQYERAK